MGYSESVHPRGPRDIHQRPRQDWEERAMNKPRAYTAEEVRAMLIDAVHGIVATWSELPDVDPATGRSLAVRDRCNAVAFSILALLDGCGALPIFKLRPHPYPDDEAHLRANGENWFDPATEIGGMLHECYLKAGPAAYGLRRQSDADRL